MVTRSRIVFYIVTLLIVALTGLATPAWFHPLTVIFMAVYGIFAVRVVFWRG